MKNSLEKIETRNASKAGALLTAFKFTLIELLTVVAVISVLAALLLPALGRSRSLAKDLGCSSMLRQIGVAGMSYSGDNDDWHLPARQESVTGSCNGLWFAVLAGNRSNLKISEMSGPYVPPYGLKFTRDAQYDVPRAQLSRYCSFLCPAEDRNTWWTRTLGYTHYAVGVVGGLLNSNFPLHRMSEITAPSRCISFVDNSATNGIGFYARDCRGGEDSYRAISYRHAGGNALNPYAVQMQIGKANYAFTDGHVSAMSYWDIYNSISAPYPLGRQDVANPFLYGYRNFSTASSP